MNCQESSVLLKLTLLTWLLQGCTAGVSFIGLPSTATLAENSPAGTDIYSFRLLLSPGASMAPGYPRILNSDPLTTAFTVSMLNTTQAMVSLTGTAELDFETTPNHFVLQILAVDSDEDSALQILSVILTDVDEPPLFVDQESVFYILEKSLPGEIYSPTVVDPENQPLTFKLIPPTSGFNIDTASGALFTTKEFNFQTDPRSYAFNFSVSDGNNTSSKTVFVHIVNAHDDKPQFLNKITSFVIPEERSPGVVITNITAVVPDALSYNGFIFYTISDNNYLAIHRYTGLVTVASRMDRDSSPLREEPIITVTVSATFRPSGPALSNSLTLDVTVTDINDNPPVCHPADQRVALSETAVVDTLITTVTCEDNDVEDVFRQHQFTGLSCPGCPSHFAFDPPASNRIVLKGNIDYEAPSNLLVNHKYSLTVMAEDKDDTSLKGSAYVYVTVNPVNEFAPVFSPSSYSYSISELLGRGTVIGAVNASDRDLPATSIHYSIISGLGSGGLSKIFFLDPKQGSISLLARPDYETTQSYRLLIRAVDGDPVRPLSATATVSITIIEANDEPPLCGPNQTNLIVSKDQHIGSNVLGFILTCTDRDSPPASFIYSISGASNLNNHFVFSPSSGSNVTRLLLKEPFDFESGLDRVWRYSLTVLISDGNLRRLGRAGPGDLTQTGTVIINIQVVDPHLTTVKTTTTPRVTYHTVTENTFSMDDWYVWFIIALGAMLLLAGLAFLLYHCCRWLSTKDCNCCQPSPAEEKEMLFPEPAPPKREFLVEVTKINTVFDGEEVDPVTKRVYEYNSKSGARRWKDMSTASEPTASQPGSGTLILSENPASSSQCASQSSAQTVRGRTGTGQSQPRSEGDGGSLGNQGGEGGSARQNLSVPGSHEHQSVTGPKTPVGTSSDA